MLVGKCPESSARLFTHHDTPTLPSFSLIYFVVVVLLFSSKLWSLAHLLWENGGTICFPQEKKVFVPKGEMPARPNTTDLHENEASYLFSLNKCRNFAQAHIANTGRMHNEARFSSSKPKHPERSVKATRLCSE